MSNTSLHLMAGALAEAGAGLARLTAERDALAAKVARVEALIDDFSNERREHVAGCEGEDTCPACWAEDITKALGGDA